MLLLELPFELLLPLTDWLLAVVVVPRFSIALTCDRARAKACQKPRCGCAEEVAPDVRLLLLLDWLDWLDIALLLCPKDSACDKAWVKFFNNWRS